MPETISTSPLQQIAEHIANWRTAELHIDADRRLVRNIALAGLESVNGYRYSEKALREAVPLYENKPVFLDHARNVNRPFERSTRDLVGSVVHPRFENGRLRGDIQTLDTEAGRTFIALAESKNPAVGMSHVVLARRNADNTLVEKIEEVVSVDAVVFPATSATFREQREGNAGEPAATSSSATASASAVASHLEPDDWPLQSGHPLREGCSFEDDLSVEETRPPFRDGAHAALAEDGLRSENDPDEADRNSASSKAERLKRLEEQLAALSRERETLRRQLDRYKTRHSYLERRQQVERLLRESGVPEFAITPLWKRQLLEAADEKTRRQLLAERLTLLNRLRVQCPESCERDGEGNGSSRDELIVAAIRGGRSPAVMTDSF